MPIVYKCKRCFKLTSKQSGKELLENRTHVCKSCKSRSNDLTLSPAKQTIKEKKKKRIKKLKKESKELTEGIFIQKTKFDPDNPPPQYRDLMKRKIVGPFYESKQWKTLRYAVLREYGRKCMCCGQTEGVMHVDHIKPRSKYKELELSFYNLQVLCKACNEGKSSIFTDDFRSPKTILRKLTE